MMKNLEIILNNLSKIWNNYITYEKVGDNSFKLIIKYNIISYDISYNNINDLSTKFKQNYKTISNACFFVCSDEIKKLINQLNNSNDEKKSYDTIIQLLRQYILENINNPRQNKELVELGNIINNLEKIKGGKLRKVRKTKVVQKKTKQVIRKL